MLQERGIMVARDPFARAGLRRICEGSGDCQWCGQRRRRVYTYRLETDWGTQPILGQPIGARHSFCNLDCFRAYAG